MCGRTGLSLNKDQMQCACSYKPKGSDLYTKPIWLPEHNNGREYVPSFNIAPTEVTPVLISSSAKGTEGAREAKRALKPMMWGMMPPWHKDVDKPHNFSTHNCRLENIKSSKLYSPVLKTGGRCVVVVEGFYEWQTTNKAKVRQPYYIYAPQDENLKIDDPQTRNDNYNEIDGWKGVRLLHIAGLYNVWKNEEIIIYSYSVITMDSNNTLDWLHHRMPAVLDSQEQIQAWLDIDNVSAEMAISYLKPVDILSWHQVSILVNSSRNKTIDCMKRREEDKKNKNSQKTLNAWFTPISKRKSSNILNEEVKKAKH